MTVTVTVRLRLPTPSPPRRAWQRCPATAAWPVGPAHPAAWQVRYDGTPANVQGAGQQHVSIVLPLTARNGTVSLTYCGATTTTTITVPAPTIASATAVVTSQTGGPVTVTEGQPITVTGSGFPMAQGSGVGLYLGGKRLTDIVSWQGGVGDGSITAVVPPDFPLGTYPLTIRTGAGVSNAVTLTVDPQHVVPPPPVLTAPATMTQGQTATATASPSRVAWSSSNPAVLAVSPGGVLRAMAPGTAYVIASDAGGKGSALVRVLPVAQPAQGSVAPTAPQPAQPTPPTVTPVAQQSRHIAPLRIIGAAPLAVGGQEVLTTTGGSATGTTTWLSSNPSVAPVTPQGTVTGRAPGVATIEATRGGQVARAEVRVTGPAPAQATRKPVQRNSGLLVTLAGAGAASALFVLAAVLRRRRKTVPPPTQRDQADTTDET